MEKQKYIYVRSPMKAGELLGNGFSYIKAPLAGEDAVFVFEATDELMKVLLENYTFNKDYTVSCGAKICF